MGFFDSLKNYGKALVSDNGQSSFADRLGAAAAFRNGDYEGGSGILSRAKDQHAKLAEQKQLYSSRLGQSNDPNDAFRYATDPAYRTMIEQREYEKSQPKHGFAGRTPYTLKPDGTVEYGQAAPMTPEEVAAAEDRDLQRAELKAYRDAQLKLGEGRLSVSQQNANRPRGGAGAGSSPVTGRSLGSGSRPAW